MCKFTFQERDCEFRLRPDIGEVRDLLDREMVTHAAMSRLAVPVLPGHVLYMVSRCACHNCPRHGVTCKTKRPSIVRTERDELLREVEEYRQTPEAQATFRRRKWSVEPDFLT